MLNKSQHNLIINSYIQAISQNNENKKLLEEKNNCLICFRLPRLSLIIYYTFERKNSKPKIMLETLGSDKNGSFDGTCTYLATIFSISIDN